MLYSMDLTVLNLAVPALSADLKPSSSQLLWIIDIYGFMVAGALITMGTLGDRIGCRHLRLFRAPAFSGALTTYMLATFVAFGAYIFRSQYLQLVLGLSPLEAGLWTLPWSAAFIVGSNLTPIIARRVRPALVVAGGLALTGVGFAILTQIDRPSGLGVLVAARWSIPWVWRRSLLWQQT